MERIRKLFPRRKLLRLGRAQRLRTDDTDDARRHGKFCIQNARSLSAAHKTRAEQTDDPRRVRLRSAQSACRCCALGARSTRAIVLRSLAGYHRFLLVERRLAKRRL